MPVVGSTISIDLHLTEDADLESVRGATRQSERVHPEVAGRVQRIVETKAAEALDGEDLGDYSVSVDVDIVQERVPGAPRERVSVSLDFEGDDSVVAGVDDAISPPDRAQIADALEADMVDYLEEYDLADAVEVIVSVTPIQFR